MSFLKELETVNYSKMAFFFIAGIFLVKEILNCFRIRINNRLEQKSDLPLKAGFA